ncbi:MAG: hypothetical protein FJ264_12275 [Planctomycetes bacterium]|nr:hypothetical protein [Planctomycetota bacterium]
MGMMQLSLLCVIPVVFAVVNGVAAEDNEKCLTQVFDAYNELARAGDVDKMLALRTSEMQNEIRSQIKSKDDRDYFVQIGRAQSPESYEVQHVAWTNSGKGAELYLLLQLPVMKEIERPRVRAEAMITFKEEEGGGGGWKMDNILLLGDPDKIKRPKDLSYNEEDADTAVTSAEVAGRIVKLEFKPNHTLIMVRVMDEEIAVFLPSKEVLENAGVNFDDLSPWKMRIFTGYPHKTDNLKFFATGDSPME